MPQDLQGERSRGETVEFKHMLKHANLLYLGTRVLILLDLSYIGRFWTLFEAWLSMQAVSPEGLKPATPEQQRLDIVPIHGANNITGESLKAMWASRTPQEAYDLLKEPDVSVTNQSDKEIQLEKLLQLDDEVRKVMCMTGMAKNKGELDDLILDIEAAEKADSHADRRVAGSQTRHRRLALHGACTKRNVATDAGGEQRAARRLDGVTETDG